MTLETSDRSALEAFYSSALGLKALSREDDRTWLACGSRARLGLWTPGEKEFGDEGGRHVHFALSVTSGGLDATCARLRELGIEFEGPVENSGGDRSIYVETRPGASSRCGISSSAATAHPRASRHSCDGQVAAITPPPGTLRAAATAPRRQPPAARAARHRASAVSSEERQRELRERGSRPAETQKQEQARSNRELLARADAERTARQRHSPDEPTPTAEDDEARPTPRR